jgi:hypothetical protein
VYFVCQCVLCCGVTGNSLLRSRSADDAFGRSFVLHICHVKLPIESLSGNRHSEDFVRRRAVC